LWAGTNLNNESLIEVNKPSSEQSIMIQRDEIDLRELLLAIWKGKLLIVCFTTIFTIGAIFLALSLPDEYEASAILAPVANSSGSALSGLAGQFGGLASLAGINLGGKGGDDKSVMAIELLKTWGFLDAFIRENHIEVEVFAAKGWSREENKLILDNDIYDLDSKSWVRTDFNPNKGQKPEPSSWELFDALKERVSMTQDKKTGLINLKVEYFSPVIAKEWVDKLVKLINQHFQKQDKQDALKSIAYLKKQIEKTNVADMKSVFFQLIEEQTKSLMLAEVNDEYVFKILSPARVAEETTKPNRVVIVILGLLIGGLISIFIVLIRHAMSINNMSSNK
jgi:LPS O-antigen subunit length determinant protein (WzzB/FepE family)